MEESGRGDSSAVTTSRRHTCTWELDREFESRLGFGNLAPQSGYVSNFCGLKRGPLEPLQLLTDQRRAGKTDAPILTGCPAEMLLELREHVLSERVPLLTSAEGQTGAEN